MARPGACGRAADLEPVQANYEGGAPGVRSSGEASEPPARSWCSQTGAMLIKRVYEFDPLACPCRRPDKGRHVHRTAAGGRHREDSASLRAMASIDAPSLAKRRRLGLRPGLRLRQPSFPACIAWTFHTAGQ